jgi:hypothetical protein
MVRRRDLEVAAYVGGILGYVDNNFPITTSVAFNDLEEDF